MQPRNVTIKIKLWTNAPIPCLQDFERWRAFFLGKNPSWTDAGTHPVVQVRQAEDIQVDDGTAGSAQEQRELVQDGALGAKTPAKAKPKTQKAKQ